MGRRGADHPPTTVTADYQIRLLKPTPTDRPVRLRAHVVESTDDRATVEGTLESDGVVTATCRATFRGGQARPSRLRPLVSRFLE